MVVIFIERKIFTSTNEKIVINRMKYPEQCIIKKGYFPDTANDIEDEFCFVNLDMDLYKPQLEGLNFFYERMIPGGIILMHDYFSEFFSGTRKAIEKFEKDNSIELCKVTIGDLCSIAIIKR